jgi:hypothetical protein
MFRFEKGDTDMETCFNYTEKDHGYFSSDERKFINKVHKLKDQYPDEVRIIAEPEENDGCIYCELPTAWFTIRVPKKVVLTDEKRAELSERMKQIHRNVSV